jgi:hypothetical protein
MTTGSGTNRLPMLDNEAVSHAVKIPPEFVGEKKAL